MSVNGPFLHQGFTSPASHTQPVSHGVYALSSTKPRLSAEKDTYYKTLGFGLDCGFSFRTVPLPLPQEGAVSAHQVLILFSKVRAKARNQNEIFMFRPVPAKIICVRFVRTYVCFHPHPIEA